MHTESSHCNLKPMFDNALKLVNALYDHCNLTAVDSSTYPRINVSCCCYSRCLQKYHVDSAHRKLRQQSSKSMVTAKKNTTHDDNNILLTKSFSNNRVYAWTECVATSCLTTYSLQSHLTRKHGYSEHCCCAEYIYAIHYDNVFYCMTKDTSCFLI
jgi:hypothetical protein